MDLLREAWELLEPGERPDGVDKSGYSTAFDPMGWPHRCVLDFARDRMIVAVEGVLLRAGRIFGWDEDRGYAWGNPRQAWCPWVSDPDRLAAAVAALRAERGRA